MIKIRAATEDDVAAISEVFHGCSAGLVGAGECLGEVALLTGAAHSATAMVRSDVHAGVITGEDLNALVRQRPDIGVVLYRNLAKGFGSRLKRLDVEHRDV